MLVPSLLCGALATGLGLSACAARRDGAAPPGTAETRIGTEQPLATGVGEGAPTGDSAESPRRQPPWRDRREGARTFVFECERGSAVGGLSFVATIEGETAWLFLPSKTVSLPRVEAASWTRYADGEMLFGSKGEEALLEWRGQRYTGCRNNPRAAIWEHAKLNGVDFRAVGQEPGWSLEIRRADAAVLVSDYGTVRHTFPWAEPVNDPGTPRTTYWMQSGREELKVVLEPGPCHDTMSGEKFETTVTLWLNGRRLRGCGRAL